MSLRRASLVLALLLSFLGTSFAASKAKPAMSVQKARALIVKDRAASGHSVSGVRITALGNSRSGKSTHFAVINSHGLVTQVTVNHATGKITHDGPTGFLTQSAATHLAQGSLEKNVGGFATVVNKGMNERGTAFVFGEASSNDITEVHAKTGELTKFNR